MTLLGQINDVACYGQDDNWRSQSHHVALSMKYESVVIKFSLHAHDLGREQCLLYTCDVVKSAFAMHLSHPRNLSRMPA